MSYEALKKKIYSAKFDLENGDVYTSGPVPISLADVLMALEAKREQYWLVDSQGKIQSEFESKHCFWNLTTDLDGQSEEVRQFLMNILL